MTSNRAKKRNTKSRSSFLKKIYNSLPSLVDGDSLNSSTTDTTSRASHAKSSRVQDTWLGNDEKSSKVCRKTSGIEVDIFGDISFAASSAGGLQDFPENNQLVTKMLSTMLSQDSKFDRDDASVHSTATPIMTNTSSSKRKSQNKQSPPSSNPILKAGGCSFFNYNMKKNTADQNDEFYYARSTFSSDFEDFANFEDTSDMFQVKEHPILEIETDQSFESFTKSSFPTNSDLFDNVDNEIPLTSTTQNMSGEEFLSQQEMSDAFGDAFSSQQDISFQTNEKHEKLTQASGMKTLDCCAVIPESQIREENNSQFDFSDVFGDEFSPQQDMSFQAKDKDQEPTQAIYTEKLEGNAVIQKSQSSDSQFENSDMFEDGFSLCQNMPFQTQNENKKPTQKIIDPEILGHNEGVQESQSSDENKSSFKLNSDLFDGLEMENDEEFVSSFSEDSDCDDVPQNDFIIQPSVQGKESISSNNNTQQNSGSFAEVTSSKSEEGSSYRIKQQATKTYSTQTIEFVPSKEKNDCSEVVLQNIKDSLLLHIGWVKSIVRIFLNKKDQQLNRTPQNEIIISSNSNRFNESNQKATDRDGSPRSVARLDFPNKFSYDKEHQDHIGADEIFHCDGETCGQSAVINLASAFRDQRAQKLRLFYIHQYGSKDIDTENIVYVNNFANTRLHEQHVSIMMNIDLDSASPYFKLSMKAHEQAILFIENQQYAAALNVYENLDQSSFEQSSEFNRERILINSYILHNIAVIHMQTGAYDVSVTRFMESLSLRLTLDQGNMFHLDIAKTLNAMGLAYFAANCLDDSLQIFEDALSILHTIDSEHFMVTNILSNLAVVNFFLGRQEVTMKKFEEGLDLQRKLLVRQLTHNSNGGKILSNTQEFIEDVVEVLCDMTYLHYFSGKVDEALIFLEEAISTHRNISGQDETLQKLENFQKVLVAQRGISPHEKNMDS